MIEQIRYYKRRAKEYELVYQKPERQKDLVLIKKYLGKQFINKSIVEIACGTGYWTKILSQPAKSIIASDINKEVLEIAKKKNYPKANVSFEIKDINNLKKPTANFEGLFGGFIWSHIFIEQLSDFLTKVSNQVGKKADIIFLDNKFVEGSSTSINRMDEFGNSYQKRKLTSGEEFEVIKNFPIRNEIENLSGTIGLDFEWIEFEYYWIVKFIKK